MIQEFMQGKIDMPRWRRKIFLIGGGLRKALYFLADAPIEVYALEYRLLPEDLSKVVLAGGMQVDEDGQPTSFMAMCWKW